MTAHPQNWASGGFVPRELPVPPAQPTEFEKFVTRQGLAKAPHLWPYDNAIHRWVKENKNRRYVPEQLLAALRMHVVMDE